MFIITDTIQIPEDEFRWSFARSGGPGGQNVNKVSSKAILRWSLTENVTIPEDVKLRLQKQQKRRMTQEGDWLVMSDRYRDQERNRQDCLDKLRQAVLEAMYVPKKRKPTKPTRGSKERRIQNKKARSQTKAGRQKPKDW